MATLTHETTTVTLSDDLFWQDEFEWNPVEQSVTRTLTGGMIIDSSEMQGGRQITLTTPDEDSAWTRYEDVLKLHSLAATPGLVMQFTFRGVTRNVMFRHQDKDAVVAKAVVFYRDPVDLDPYLVTLKLMEI